MSVFSFTGTVQTQERQKTVERAKVNELDGVRHLLQKHVREQLFTNQFSEKSINLNDLQQKFNTHSHFNVCNVIKFISFCSMCGTFFFFCIMPI